MRYSFIIPIYNCKAHLRSCVSNVLSMDLQDPEIILVDDGSTDGSDTVCDLLSEDNPQVHVIHQENQGVSAARNHGLQRASGDYVIFLDADDAIEPDKLRMLLQIVAADETIDMAVFGMSFDYYYHGKCYRRDSLCPPVPGKLNSRQWIRIMPELFAANSLSPVWNKVFKRKLLLESRLELSQEMFLYEDLEYSLRCMAFCNTIYFSPEVVYHYRQSEDEGNAGRRLRRIEHLPALIDRIESALDWLIEKQHGQAQEVPIRSILLRLYLVLAREKISISNAREIRVIGDDLKSWLEKHSFDTETILTDSDQQYLKLIKNKNVLRLIQQRSITAIRHKIAVKVKNTKLYQRYKRNL